MNKKLIAILTLVMFAVTLLPMGAFAATTNSVIVAGVTTEGDSKTLNSRIRITEPSTSVGSLAVGGLITFTLQGAVEFADSGAGIDADIAAGLTGDGVNLKTSDLSVVSATKKSFTISIDSRTATGAATIDINFVTQAVFNTTGAIGPVVLEVTQSGTGVTTGQITIGEVLGGRTTAAVMSTEKVSIDSTDQEIGGIRIKEVATDSFRTGATRIGYIKLPADMYWAAAPTATEVNIYGGAVFADFTFNIVTKDGRDAIEVVRVNNNGASIAPAGPFTMEISGMAINVDSDARMGDIEVILDGEFTTQTFVLGSVVDYSVEAYSDTTTTLYVGDTQEKIGTFYIEEGAAGSILPNRNIRMTLPKGIIWTKAPDISVRAGDSSVFPGAITSISNDGRELTFSITGSTANAAKVRLKDAEVAVLSTFAPGDVFVEFTGPAGVTGEVKVAEVKAPVTVTTNTSDVEIGKQAQTLADVVVAETVKGTFESGKTLSLVLPTGWSFNGTPKVEVVEGDVSIDDVTKTGTNTLNVNFKRTSTKVSSVKITGIKVDLDRTIAEGNYDFKITGNALNKVAYDTVNGDAPLYAADNVANVIDAKTADAVYKYTGAVVVTPAGENVVKPVTMTVGSTIYTISGVENDMDVAPYIKSDRTYFPVRYVANALGINDENVVWDPAQRTVTIFRANRIVQVTIGSTTMLVNGVPVTMDVAPEITAERTMLPIRFVAQGLGVNVSWDAATQTVTLN